MREVSDMNNYILSACSTADLTKEQFETLDVKCIYFHYSMDGVQYPDDLGQTISFDEFYEKMKNGADTRTSQINPDEFIAYFTPFLEEGKDILHVSLSSGISGVYNSACIAKEELEEKYPERKITIVDSLTASAGYGLMMDKAAELKNAGYSMEELASWLEANKLKLHAWFFSSDLTFFVKGGRVSKTSGFVGTILNICPLLNVNFEGKLIPREKIRTKKKAVIQIVKKMEELAQDGLDYSGKCFISMSACLEDAQAVAKLIEEKFPKLNGKVMINYIGTTIGSHTGPGTVALFFWGKERID